MAKRWTSSGRGGAVAVLTLASAFLAIGLLVNVTETGGWGRFVGSLGTSQSAERKGPGADDQGLGPILSLPNVIVRLRADDEDLYLNVAFDLEVATERDKDAVRERLPRIQEATIRVLSDMTPADVRGSQQLAKAKARLLERFRSVVPGRQLRSLYVNYLVVG